MTGNPFFTIRIRDFRVTSASALSQYAQHDASLIGVFLSVRKSEIRNPLTRSVVWERSTPSPKSIHFHPSLLPTFIQTSVALHRGRAGVRSSSFFLCYSNRQPTNVHCPASSIQPKPISPFVKSPVSSPPLPIRQKPSQQPNNANLSIRLKPSQQLTEVHSSKA